jgi:hypothetical protein
LEDFMIICPYLRLSAFICVQLLIPKCGLNRRKLL